MTNISQNNEFSEYNNTLVPFSNVSSMIDINIDSLFQNAYNSLLRWSHLLLPRNNPNEGVLHHLPIARGASFIFNKFEP